MTDLLYGVDSHWDTAEWICCNNHDWAEPSGFHENVGLWPALNKDGPNVFYDSVCGIPLFVAPIGRSFEEFKRESDNHGWPSFRPEETVADNVIIHFGGRMESSCNSHLGHNLPDFSGARYCIDLVCIAGKPLTLQLDPSFNATNSNATNFDPNNFKSLSGSWQQGFIVPTWFLWILVCLVVILFTLYLKFRAENKDHKNNLKTRPLPPEFT
jgi:peptide methionine sulfoxide reductase MsrB